MNTVSAGERLQTNCRRFVFDLSVAAGPACLSRARSVEADLLRRCRKERSEVEYCDDGALCVDQQSICFDE